MLQCDSSTLPPASSLPTCAGCWASHLPSPALETPPSPEEPAPGLSAVWVGGAGSPWSPSLHPGLRSWKAGVPALASLRGLAGQLTSPLGNLTPPKWKIGSEISNSQRGEGLGEWKVLCKITCDTHVSPCHSLRVAHAAGPQHYGE